MPTPLPLDASPTPAHLPARRREWREVLGLLIFFAVVSVYRLLVLRYNGLDLYLDEAQYWTWAQHLDWGYFSKPPMIAGVIAATTAVCGNGVVCIKSGAVLIYPLVSLLIYATARRLFTRPDESGVAVWSSLSFFMLPGAAFSAMIISTDVPLFLFWTAALYAYVRAIESTRWHWWLLAGLAAGLGLLTKYTMVIFALSVLLHLGTRPQLRAWLRNPKPYAAMLIAALVFAPNLFWNSHNGWPTLHHTEQISHLNSDAGLHWNHLIEFLGGQFAITGPVLLTAFLLQLMLLRKIWIADERLRLLACFALPFLVIISLQALLGRANANWGAMTYSSAIIFSVALLIRQQQRRWLIAGLVFNLTLMLAAYHFDWLADTFGIELTAKTDLYKRVRGWNELGRQASVVQSQYPQALLLGDSRDVLAELEYYVTPQPLNAVLWNPQATIDSHYALTTTMNDKLGRDFIYVTGRPALDAQIIASFDSIEALPPLHVTVRPQYALDYHVWLLQHFDGYRNSTPVAIPSVPAPAAP